MEKIITGIQNQLQNCKELLYIDENWGQLDYYSNNPPVKWPCILIDVTSATYTNQGRNNQKTPINRQIGDVVVELRIADVKKSNTSAKAPRLQKAYARSIWSIIESVHQLLHGWHVDESSSSLQRVSINRVRRDDGVQEYAIRYVLETRDC